MVTIEKNGKFNYIINNALLSSFYIEGRAVTREEAEEIEGNFDFLATVLTFTLTRAFGVSSFNGKKSVVFETVQKQTFLLSIDTENGAVSLNLINDFDKVYIQAKKRFVSRYINVSEDNFKNTNRWSIFDFLLG